MMTLALFASVLASVIVAVLGWKNRVVAIAFVLALLPSYLVRFQLFGIPLTMLECMILVLFVVWCVRYILIERGALQIGFFPAMLILLFLAAGVFGMIAAPDFRAAAGVFKAYMVEPILFYIVCVHSLRNARAILLAVGALLLSATTISLIAIVQYVTGWWIPEPWQAWPARRATSVYGYPNAVGLFVAPVTALWCGLYCFQKNLRRYRLFIAPLILLCMGGLVAARVDGGIIALAAAGGAVALFSRFRSAAIGIGVLAVVIAFLFEPTRELLLFQNTSGDVRLALWKGTWNLLQAHPLFGAGLAGFPALYDLYRLPSHVELLQYPHNLFLDVWVELGILGVLWLVGTLVYFSVRVKKIFSSDRARVVACVAALCAVVVYGVVDVPYFKNDLSVLFWTLLAFVHEHKMYTQGSTKRLF